MEQKPFGAEPDQLPDQQPVQEPVQEQKQVEKVQAQEYPQEASPQALRPAYSMGLVWIPLGSTRLLS